MQPRTGFQVASVHSIFEFWLTATLPPQTDDILPTLIGGSLGPGSGVRPAMEHRKPAAVHATPSRSCAAYAAFPAFSLVIAGVRTCGDRRSRYVSRSAAAAAANGDAATRKQRRPGA